MRQALVRWILFTLTILPAWAQQDPLQGRWEGMARSSQGERKVTVSFKKEGGAYTGVISGVGGGTEVPFKEVKLEGEKGSGGRANSAAATGRRGGVSNRQRRSRHSARGGGTKPSDRHSGTRRGRCRPSSR